MKEKKKEELLIRLDERTERIENTTERRMQKLEEDVGSIKGKTQSLDDRVQSVEGDVGTGKFILAGLVTVVGGAIAKIFEVLPI